MTFEEKSILEKIGAVAFYYMLYVTEVDVPDNVRTIGNLAFGYCKRLESVTLPDNEEVSIHPNAFKNTAYAENV